MKIWIIALNTFREAVRNKVFYTLLFFAVIFVALSLSLSTMILGDYVHIIIDMGLANIEIFGTMIAIFVGISLVYKELERRTIYTIITRPIQRWQFIVGKYLGLCLTLLVQVIFMSSIFFIIVAAFGEGDQIPALAAAIWLCFIKLLLITSVAVMFSSFSTPILSGMLTLGFYVIGSVSTFLRLLIEDANDPFFSTMVRMLMFILPDFSFLDIKGEVVYEMDIGIDRILGASIYGLLYTAIILLFSIQIFEKRDLK